MAPPLRCYTQTLTHALILLRFSAHSIGVTRVVVGEVIMSVGFKTKQTKMKNALQKDYVGKGHR